MDRNALLGAVPVGQEWDRLDPRQRKDAVERLLESILDELANEQREPDRWEATDMGAALNAIQMGWYNAAISYAMYALVPPEERAGEWQREETTPTSTELRNAVEYIKGMPARGI